MWTTYLFNLLGRSWENMVKATGTTTLGFILWTLALTWVSWAATVAARWVELKREKVPLPFRNAILSSIWPGGAFLAVGVFGLVLVAFVVFVGVTIYIDHQSLVSQNVGLRQRNTVLESTLRKKTHSLDTTDPVFPNIIYLLQAFNIFRHANSGVPCVIRVTAPPESLPMASMVAQFSNSVSGCYTFGPDNPGNPDLDRIAVEGMVPDAIVFHAAREDQAAGQLFAALSNYIQLRRSYELPNEIRNYRIPEQGREHIIWLQFGTGVKWNSELMGDRLTCPRFLYQS